MRKFEATAIHNSCSVPVEIEGCEDVLFEQRVVLEFWTEEKTFSR
jgi:hypothetical protein